jgi:hypothetical protein
MVIRDQDKRRLTIPSDLSRALGFTKSVFEIGEHLLEHTQNYSYITLSFSAEDNLRHGTIEATTIQRCMNCFEIVLIPLVVFFENAHLPCEQLGQRCLAPYLSKVL